MASSFKILAPYCLVLLAVSSCAQFDAAAANAANAAAAAANKQASTPATSAPSTPAAGQTNGSAGAAGSGQTNASTGAAGSASAGGSGASQGTPGPIGRPQMGTAILTPCTQSFIKLDTNGDGWVDASEWAAAGKDTTGADAAASFKAKDTDGNGKLDRLEFGCERPPTDSNGHPTGAG